MKIAHVVTLLSPDGAYGGPVRVAVNQLYALRELGHEVRLFSTVRGYDARVREYEGIPATVGSATQVLPGLGFSGLTSTRMLRTFARVVTEFDIVHVHLGRDLVTLPAAWLAMHAKVPLVLQTHGMIDRSSRWLASPLDRFLTRPVMEGARAVLYLTETEKRNLGDCFPEPLRLRRLENGVPQDRMPSPINWSSPEVLFLARLHPRKRATAFVDAALMVCREFPNARFTLVGPDEGEGAEVRSRIQDGNVPNVAWDGPVDPGSALERTRRSAVYVLPSLQEPFPMSVLEAASLGRPVVVTESCGLAKSIREFGAGLVVDESVEALAAAILKLLGDPMSATEMGQNARRMCSERFGMPAIVARLEGCYFEATESTGGGEG